MRETSGRGWLERTESVPFGAVGLPILFAGVLFTGALGVARLAFDLPLGDRPVLIVTQGGQAVRFVPDDALKYFSPPTTILPPS